MDECIRTHNRDEPDAQAVHQSDDRNCGQPLSKVSHQPCSLIDTSGEVPPNIPCFHPTHHNDVGCNSQRCIIINVQPFGKQTHFFDSPSPSRAQPGRRVDAVHATREHDPHLAFTMVRIRARRLIPGRAPRAPRRGPWRSEVGQLCFGSVDGTAPCAAFGAFASPVAPFSGSLFFQRRGPRRWAIAAARNGVWIGDVVASHSAHPTVVLVFPDSAASVERVASWLHPTWAPFTRGVPGKTSVVARCINGSVCRSSD